MKLTKLMCFLTIIKNFLSVQQFFDNLVPRFHVNIPPWLVRLSPTSFKVAYWYESLVICNKMQCDIFDNIGNIVNIIDDIEDVDDLDVIDDDDNVYNIDNLGSL